ncbi:ABC transporter ATP-binding protein [Paraburkholderia sp. LEh10]|uniref:ABC transporter ATP-binding protein n=1 Tax=Paraburkholderia sp. LEh10 TaxID=2821353 RepID=UPI001AE4234B|nr:ABC transporter ATP-binding protein [Paraburkholderia sp. LEh10]MBP0590443.1 ABC transporter ATP-binding protein [Paraburkholderia sp. LEh10]
MAEYVIQTMGLGKEFRGFKAVSDLDLKVRKGSIHALIGPNGAGKSTVFNLITKFLQPSKGQILYKGEDITQARPEEVALKGLVRSFQISAVFPHLTVRDNVCIALQQSMRNWFHFWRSERVLDSLNERAMELVHAVGLEEYEDIPAVQLPYGRKRALELATTLAVEPEVLLLDEPLAGMGHEDIDRTAELIRRVAKHRTILMVEHNLSVVASLCDTITVLTRGRTLAEGTYYEVSRNPEVRAAYMGTANE